MTATSHAPVMLTEQTRGNLQVQRLGQVVMPAQEDSMKDASLRLQAV